MRTRFRARAAAPAALALGLLASACGGGSGDGATPDDPASQAAAEAAQANLDQLESSSDVTMIEVLDVTDGSITTLADTVTGDRPVLVWFWAPH